MIAHLSRSAVQLLQSAAVATIVTVNDDGSPHVSSAWVGIEDGEIVFATLPDQRKLHNMRRDSRVAVSVQGERVNEWGLREYLVVYGTARISEGGAADMLQRLAHVYLGPDVIFPQMPNPPPGFITHVKIERVGGIGPWQSSSSGR